MKKMLLSAMLIATGLGSAQACDLSNWTAHGATASSVVADDAIRYEGLCALKAASAGQYAEAALSGAGTDTYVRFFVYAANAQTNATVFSLDTLEGKINGGNFEVGGASKPLSAGKWHLVQVQVTPAATNLWVDDFSAAAKDTGSTGLAAAPTSLKLGSVNGALSGELYIDSVVVSNAEAVDNKAVNLPSGTELFAGDANGDGVVNIGDVIETLRSAQGLIGHSVGVPDSNKDGVVNIGDVINALRKAQGLIPLD